MSLAQPPPTLRPGWRRRPPRRYWLPAAGLVLVLLSVGLGGGFGRAPAVGVATFSVDRAITLQRWVVVVEQVELVDTTSYDSPQAPALRVKLTATWTGDRSTFGLPQGLIGVVVPDGPSAAVEQSAGPAGRYSGGFDPDLPRPAVLDFTWPDGATESAPPVPAPSVVQVVISDERPAQNFLFPDSWATTDPIGQVSVPVTDRRTRR